MRLILGGRCPLTAGSGRPVGRCDDANPRQIVVRSRREEKDHPATRVLGTLFGLYPRSGGRV